MSISEVAQKKLQRVRALLAQAEDRSVTEEEAAAFHAKAFELMAVYGIEMAMLESSGPNASAAPEKRTIIVTPPWALDSASLLYNLALAFRCTTVRLHRADKRIKSHEVHAFGFPSDLDRLDMVYTSLLIQMHSGVLSADVPSYESTKSFRKGWVVGWVNRVIDRVKTAEEYARKSAEQSSNGTNSGTEIVLVNREAAVASLAATHHPKMKFATNRTRSLSGFRSGLQAGDSADIGQARMAGRHAIGR